MRRWMSIITATCARKKRILGHFCEQCVTWGESDCVGERPVATIPNPIKCLGIRKMMSKDFNVIKKQTTTTTKISTNESFWGLLLDLLEPIRSFSFCLQIKRRKFWLGTWHFLCVCVCGYLKKLNDSFLGGYLKRFKQLGEGIWFQTVDKQVCGKRNLAS